MLYLVGLFFFLAAWFRLWRALGANKVLLSEHGASSIFYSWLRRALWLFPIPTIAQLVPYYLVTFGPFPVPVSIVLFAPAIILAWRVRKSLPPGGYDYQVAATEKVMEIVWLGCGGITLVLAPAVFSWLLFHR
jgi:hypothetical protein